MKQKRIALTIIEVIILTVLELLALTILNTQYLFGWAEHNWKFYVGLVLVVLLLNLFNKHIVAAFMTSGIVVGIFMGNYLGGYIKELNIGKIVHGMKAEEVYRLRHHPGFEMWMGIILISIVIGVVVQNFVSKKTMRLLK